MAIRGHLALLGYNQEWMGPRDRTYFVSLYNRTPGGALFEYAWSKPELWTIDEPADELGQTYKIPPTFLDQADTILDYLEPLEVRRMTLSSSTVDVSGRSTEVLSAGDGEPVVFLHGGGIIEGFDCFEPLTERFRVLAPLRPGYGATELDPPLNGRDEEAGNVRDVLDALGIERTVLVGHSLGGWLAATVAARFPDRVSALVLGAPWGLDVPEHRGADMSSMSPPEIAATLTNDPSIWEGRFPSGPDPAFEAARVREGAGADAVHARTARRGTAGHPVADQRADAAAVGRGRQGQPRRSRPSGRRRSRKRR